MNNTSNNTMSQIFFVLLVVYLLPLILLLAAVVFILRRFFGFKRIVINGNDEYVFKETTLVQTKTKIIANYTFVNPETPWFKIEPDPVDSQQSIITIDGSYRDDRKWDGYAWDGCSPKILILDLVMGTPDGGIDTNTGKAITYYASMAHDLLYQFRKEFKGTITRRQADAVFYEQLKDVNFKLAGMYHFAVRAFGWTYWNT